MGLFDLFSRGNSDENEGIEINLNDFKFISPSHSRLENKKKIGTVDAGRGIRIQANILGIKDAYTVTIYNTDSNHPVWGDNIQLSPKRMKIKKSGSNEIELIGFGVDGMGSPFSDYGLTIHLTNKVAKKISLFMYDRNIKLEYYGGVESNKDVFKPAFDVLRTDSNVKIIQEHISRSFLFYEQNNIPALQMELHSLYQNFNRAGGGQLIINFPDKEKLGECFLLHLRFNWSNDLDICEVLTENAFFCFFDNVENAVTSQDKIIGSYNLLNLMYYSKNSFNTKLSDCLKAAMYSSNSPFDKLDYENGCGYLIEQFIYLSAKNIEPTMQKHEIIFGEIRKKYNEVIKDKRLINLDLQKIELKAKYVSNTIFHILKSY